MFLGANESVNVIVSDGSAVDGFGGLYHFNVTGVSNLCALSTDRSSCVGSGICG